MDIWAEVVAGVLSKPTDIKAPRQQSWGGEYGYKARNLDIAKSDLVCVVVADRYPSFYEGRRFDLCYHCARGGRDADDHVKSGACWTANQALKLGNEARWYIINN